MIDYSYCSIEHLAVHKIGNPINEEPLILSEEELIITSDDHLTDLAKHYFLSSFTNPEMYGFTFSNGNHEMNPLWEYSSQMFDEPESFHALSVDLAKHLYECSQHPNIKDGYLYVALLNGISLEGQSCKAVGLFKSESSQDFLKLEDVDDGFQLNALSGIDINKLDKGCLIFDLEMESGYMVNLVDRSGRGTEAQFWRDQFLNLRPRSDDYHHTRNFLNMTKQFVTEQVGQEFEVTKTDQIDMLNRSIEYFKENDQFDQETFGAHVFGDQEVVNSFQDFGNEFFHENEMDAVQDFMISTPAVKKQSRIFKSVLKLDKNFHVYIHGNKDLIERGVEPDGRKFYKIYYNEER